MSKLLFATVLCCLLALNGARPVRAAEPSDKAAAYAAVDRLVDVFARIDRDYIVPVDLTPLADTAVATIRARSTLDDAAWSACLSSRAPLKPSRKKKVAELAAVMAPAMDVLECVGFRDMPKADADRLMDETIRAMIAKLDGRGGWYLLQDFRPLAKGGDKSASSGMTLTRSEGLLTILSTRANTPSRRAQLKAGDVILTIDGRPTSELTLEQAIDRLRGPVSSEVTLTIKRSGQSDRSVALVREIADPVPFELMETENHLIIKIDSIPAYLATKLTERLASHNLTGKTILLDLRGNPGGLFDEAVALTDQFLDQGIIVTQKGRTPTDIEQYRARDGQVARDVPMAVFVNQGTATGAEILAAALQDNKRAIVIGAPTAGIGTIQTILPIGTTHALKLTTSRVYRPNGQALSVLTPDCAADISELDLTEAVAKMMIDAANACLSQAP